VIANLNTHEILAPDFCIGSQRDFRLFRNSLCTISPDICILADSGYQGLAEVHPNCPTPAKKSKLHPLSHEQKARNRALSQKRIRIENIIRRLKIFRILSERYRSAMEGKGICLLRCKIIAVSWFVIIVFLTITFLSSGLYHYY